MEGELNKRTIVPANIPSPEKVHPISAPPALTLKLVNLVISHIFLALSDLLPLNWELIANEFVHGHFKSSV